MRGMLGAIVFAAIAAGSVQADESVTLREGQTRTSKFRRQVQKVRVDSTDNRIVAVRYRDGYGVELRGVRAGQAEVTVSGETVAYSAGTNQPLARYTPFKTVYRVTVLPAPAPTLRPTPTPPPVREERMRVSVRVGETKQQRSWQQARNVQNSVREGRENVRVNFTRARGVEITGVRAGTAIFLVRGERPVSSGDRVRWELATYTYEVTVRE